MEETMTLLEFCQYIVQSVVNFAEYIIDALQTPIKDLLNPLFDVPIFGTVVQDINYIVTYIITGFTGDPNGDITLLQFMFGAAIPIFVAVTFVIWVLNIITQRKGEQVQQGG